MMANGHDLGEVALRIQRRHLAVLQQEIQKTRDQLQTARRSRLRRARLLRLSRRHNLERCVSQLRGRGMTTINGSRCAFFGYEPLCDGAVVRGLQDKHDELAGQADDLQHASTDSIIGNLRTLLENGAEIIDDAAPHLRWYLWELELEETHIGDMEVEVALDEFSVRVTNTSADLSERGDYHHPHVDGNGTICWNDNYETARLFHASGDFLALRDLIDNLLKTYNSGSPFITLDDWVDGLGSTCGDCGERYHDEDLYYVESAFMALCPECSIGCGECYETIWIENYNSDWDMCQECYEEFITECHVCEKERNKSDMIEYVNDETHSSIWLCKDCAPASRKEQNNEDSTDADGSLAPAVAVPANE